MTFLQIVFYLFALIAVGSATMVVTSLNPVRSVLSLVVSFFGMAGLWMLLHAEFLSLILILVYVGAVMTLFLFVVMMLNIDKEDKRSGFIKYAPVAVIIVLVLAALMITSVGPEYFGIAQMPLPPAQAANYSNVQALGNVLYTEYAYPFEIAGVILLTAIIAAITLAYRRPHRRKIQQISKQVDAKPQDYMRIVNMPSAKKEGN